MDNKCFSKDPVERFRYWFDIFKTDSGDQRYTKWVENIKISRMFRRNMLPEAMALLNAGGIYDPKEYWYNDTGANRIEDFHLGKMIMSNIAILAKEDTPTGAVDTPASQEVADYLQDLVRQQDFLSEMGAFGANYIMDGSGAIVHYTDSVIDPETGAPKVCFENADVLEFVLDCRAKTLNQIKHIFRATRCPLDEIEFEYKYEPHADTIEEYNFLNSEDKPTITDKNTCGRLEVQFVYRTKSKNYTFDPEIAAQLKLPSEILTEDAYNKALSEYKKLAGDDKEAFAQIKAMFQTAVVIPVTIQEYYQDVFSNGRSIYKMPKLLVWDRKLTKNGFSYDLLHFKEDMSSPYGLGLIVFQRDKLIIRIMLMTIAMRAMSRYKNNRSYIDEGRVDNAADKQRIMRNEGGPIFVNGDPKNVEWHPHMSPFDSSILTFVQYIDQNLREESGVTLEQTGASPYAGAPASAINMLQNSGAIQLSMRIDKYFRKLEEALTKHYVMLREYQGLKEIPNVVLEIRFDNRSKEDKQVELSQALTLRQAGIIGTKEVLAKSDYADSSDLVMKTKQAEDIGKMVLSNQQLMQIVQQYAQQIEAQQQQGR